MEQWDQQPGEPGPAYQAFVVYRDLGVARSLDAAYRKSHEAQRGRDGGADAPSGKRASGRWRTWCQAYRWAERAGAWDGRLATVAQQATEKMVATVATERTALLLEQERREHHVAGLIYGKIVEMCETGLTKRKVAKNDKGEITVIEPVKWGFSTVARLADAMSRMGRAGLNMPLKVQQDAVAEAPYFDTSGEMEAALGPGQVPAMPADVAVKPELAIAQDAAGLGLKQPKKARPPGDHH